MSSSTTPVRSVKKTYSNLANSGWEAFSAEVETLVHSAKRHGLGLRDPQIPDVYSGDNLLRDAINTASKHHIPSGRRKDVISLLLEPASRWIIERDNILSHDPTSTEIETLNNRIQMAIRQNKAVKWKEFVSSFDHPTDTAKLWKTIKALDNKTSKQRKNQPIKFKGKKGRRRSSSSFFSWRSTCQFQEVKYPPSGRLPLLKPGKLTNESASYRPMSLLCPAVKILEKCLRPILEEHLKTAEHQHGLRPRYSTVKALSELSTAIADGVNQRKPAALTVLVA